METGSRSTARWLGRRVLDVLLPPRCLSCGAVVDHPGALCPDCWRGLTFLTAPWCDACGHPFEVAAASSPGHGVLCGGCARRRPLFRRARAVLAYDEASKRLLLPFKHADRTDAAPAFGRWMARAGAELVSGAELIAPVPLHWTRLFGRRYNQAALLATALSRASGVPAVPDLLARTRRTPAQGAFGAEGRHRNVRGAFRVTRPLTAAGRRVLLVDDVLTTGATVTACSRALLNAGAAAVDVLTLARVIRG